MTHEYIREMEHQYGWMFDSSIVLFSWEEDVKIDSYMFQWMFPQSRGCSPSVSFRNNNPRPPHGSPYHDSVCSEP